MPEVSWSPSDLSKFQNDYNLIQQTAYNIGGGAVATCGPTVPSCDEANLDIQFIMSMSQNTGTVQYSTIM